MTHKNILFLGFIVGFLTLIMSFYANLDLIRWILGIAFVYFFSGYPFSLLILPIADSFLERFLVSSGLSLLLTYPAGFLNVLHEGQNGQAIFGYHLAGDIFFLLIFYFMFILILKLYQFNFRSRIEFLQRTSLLLIVPLLFAVFLNFYQLGKPDLNGDEYDLGYQSYNLVDGIFAGRKAYTLSFSAHPPLSMYIQHYTMNILSPYGLETLSDTMFRVGPAIVGVLMIVLIYLLALKSTGNVGIAFLSAVFLSVNNYHVFLSRIFHREMFLTFYMFLAIYTLLKYLLERKQSQLILMAIFTGATLLVKATGLIIIPIIVLALLWKNKRGLGHSMSWFLGVAVLVFFPVILFNIGAFITTGYTDILFSKIFNTPTHPYARMVNPSVLFNLKDLLFVLLDQYGIFLFSAFLFGLFAALRKIQLSFKWLWMSLVIIICAFFSITVIRPYYLSFVTIPLIMTLSLFLWELMGKSKLIGLGMTLILIFYSLTYTIKTEFDHSFVVEEKYTENYPIMANLLISDYSKTTRGWLEDRGWKNLRESVNQKYALNSCLAIASKISDLPLRRYLGVEDKVKKFYLKEKYLEPYRVCDDTSSGPTMSIYFDEKGVIRAKL